MSHSVEPVLLRDTDRIAVWESLLRPGESLAKHEHKVAYAVVVLEGDKIRVQGDDGSVRDVSVSHGEVLVGGPQAAHEVSNVGTATYREILVELK